MSYEDAPTQVWVGDEVESRFGLATVKQITLIVSSPSGPLEFDVQAAWLSDVLEIDLSNGHWTHGHQIVKVYPGLRGKRQRND